MNRQARYEGCFLDNKREGDGVCVYKNADKFTGEWHVDLKHGEVCAPLGTF